jgi:hypothetical protein
LLPAKIDRVELDAARHRISETPKVEIDRASIKAAQAAQGEALAGVAAATFERLRNAKPSADEMARERQRRLRNFSEQLHKEAAAWPRYYEVKAYVEHLQRQINAGEVLPEQSREWLRLAAHLAKLTDPTKARLESLQTGISGVDYNLPFGKAVVS